MAHRGRAPLGRPPPRGAKVLLVEPRRMRERAIEIAEEEADLAGGAGHHLGGQGRDFPRLYLPFDRLLSDQRVGGDVTSAPEAPAPRRSARWAGTRWPVAPSGCSASCAVGAKRYHVVVCAENGASAARLARSLQDEGIRAEVSMARGEWLRSRSGRRRCPLSSPPRQRFHIPGARARGPRRRRPHGSPPPAPAPRPRAAQVATFFDDMKTGDYVVHFQHGVARFGGMVKRSIGNVERDYLVLEYRDGDKLYVPSDQVDALRPYTGGETPALSRLNGSEWQKTKARVRKAVREIAHELVVLYQTRATRPGYVFSPDTPWQVGDGAGLPLQRDARPGEGDS